MRGDHARMRELGQRAVLALECADEIGSTAFVCRRQQQALERELFARRLIADA
jgi:hypothetical protein